MTIQILGSGCPNCRRLEENARRAVSSIGIEARFEKVADMDRIIEMGIMHTPGLAIDGEVVKSGRVYSPEEIVEMLKGYAE